MKNIRQLLVNEAIRICEEDIAINRKMGLNGRSLITDGDNILTHCNAGALATAGYGTALGVIRAAWEEGKTIHVYVDETRPVLQGARLTAWELVREGIPATLITDNMAGFLMQQGRSIWSSSGRTASPPTAIRPTRSAPTRWPSWRRRTTSPSISPRPCPPSTGPLKPETKFPSKNAVVMKSPHFAASKAPRQACRSIIPPLTSPQTGTSPPSSPKRASSGRPLKRRSHASRNETRFYLQNIPVGSRSNLF